MCEVVLISSVSEGGIIEDITSSSWYISSQWTWRTDQTLVCLISVGYHVSAQNPHPWLRPSPSGGSRLTSVQLPYDLWTLSHTHLNDKACKTHNSLFKSKRWQVFMNTPHPSSSPKPKALNYLTNLSYFQLWLGNTKSHIWLASPTSTLY